MDSNFEFKPENISSVSYLTQKYAKKEEFVNIFNDEMAMRSFMTITYTIAFYSDRTEYTAKIFDKNLETFFGELLNNLFEKRNELDFSIDNQVDFQQGLQALDLNQKRLYWLRYSIYFTNISAMYSVNFSVNYCKNNGLDAHLKFLSDNEFLNTNRNIQMRFFQNRFVSFIEYLTINVASFSKYLEENKKKWIDLDSVEILLNIAKQKPEAAFDAYLAVANIANDNQLEELTEVHSIIKNLVEALEKIANAIKGGNVTRAMRQIMENNKNVTVNVAIFYQSNKTTCSILVILTGLYRLAVNEKMKNEIYFGYKVKDSFKSIILKGNPIEIKFLLRLIAQLTFEKKISHDLSEDTEIMSGIDRILNESNENQPDLNELKLGEICKQIKWNIETSKENIPQVYFFYNIL